MCSPQIDRAPDRTSEQRRYFGLELLAKTEAMTRPDKPEVTPDLLPISA